MSDLQTSAAVPKPQMPLGRILREGSSVPINRPRRETWLQAAWRIHQETIMFFGVTLGLGGPVGGVCWGIFQLQQRFPAQVELLGKILGGSLFGCALLGALLLEVQDINAQRKEIDDA